MVTWSHEIKRLGPWNKSYDQPRQHVKKQRYYFADKGPSSQSCFSSSHVWMWELVHKESWAPKNWCFWTVALEKTLESPLGSKEIKPVSIKEINPKYSLEGLMLKLKVQYFGYQMQRANSLEKTRMLGRMEDRRRRRWQRMRWLDGITDSMDIVWASSRKWWRTGKPGVLQFMGSQVGHDWATEQHVHLYSWICK